ncbi:MAG: undecaprenyldiphospho-muramoylpentapeptide beta-N-acetylglucosaminyltransferase [Betaproteobacteria bacterium]|nr:undecaprenyldiphospho-muramoylpentapeptide beta-N-acetylglucosaminyltransferase [Betaproteobacteria bacterium]
MPHLVIMAAGTGGHITPGLAVAGEMQRRGWTVSWMGTTTGLENRLVPPSGIPMDGLAFSGLRGKGLWHTATGGLRLLKAFWDAARLLRRRRADAVLGMGGYICFPGGMMASLLGKPLMLVNADAALLLSNKALLPVADRVAFGFEGGSEGVKRAVVTGNPVRPEVAAIAPPAQRYANRQGPLRLLVVGGSLGARVLNETIPQALALMDAHMRPHVVHQTGQANAQGVEQRWADLGLMNPNVSVRPFIDDMAHELAQADVVLCRAGAITVSELCAAGVASVLVPLVVSTTAHQRHNAAYMAQQGAAVHLQQEKLTPQALADLLSNLNRQILLEMAQRARACARTDATAQVADELERLVKVS